MAGETAAKVMEDLRKMAAERSDWMATPHDLLNGLSPRKADEINKTLREERKLVRRPGMSQRVRWPRIWDK